MITPRRALSLTLLVAAILLWWVARPDPGPRHPRRLPSQTDSLQSQRAGRALGRLGAGLKAKDLQEARVSLEVRDEWDLPLAGIRLALSGVEGVTDADGRVTLESVPWGGDWSSLEVDGPWLLVEGSSEGGVRGVEQERLVILRSSCPGVVRVVDAAGSPLAGATLPGWSSYDARPTRSDGPWRVDSRGEAFLADRPCGAVSFDVWHPLGGATPRLSAEIQGNEPVTLVVPPTREGVLRVLDRDGRPIDAAATSSGALSIERLGVGILRVRSRRAAEVIALRTRGYPSQRARVPLDGGEHLLTLGPDREVAATLLCEGACPDAITCGDDPCEPAGNGLFQCLCPLGPTSIGLPIGALDAAGLAPASEALARVPGEASEITVDLRWRAGIRGQWTGNLPCEVEIGGPPGLSERGTQPCDADGGFRVGELRAGPATVTIRHGRSEIGAVQVELRAGETLDVGELGPNGMRADGMIEADFPLNDALLVTEPRARNHLADDGSFRLRGVPPGTAQIALELQSAQYGSFRAVLPLLENGLLPTWELRWEESSETAPLSGASATYPEL